MNKRQRNNTILILIIILLISLIGVFYIAKNSKDTPKIDEKPTLSVIKYNVYDYENVDFRFIVAEIGVESDHDLNIPLSEIYITDLSLDKQSDYIQLLRDNNYNDDFTQIDQAFISKDSKPVTLFIPVVDNESKIATITSKHFDNIEFDLSKNLVVLNETPVVEEPDPDVDKEPDQIENVEKTIDEPGYKIIVSPSYSDRDFMYYVDGQEFNSSSNEVLHAFPITLISKDNKTYEITDAKFVFDDIGSEIAAKEATFKTRDVESILNEKTNSEATGALIFISYSQSLEPVNYKGSLFVKVNNGEWFELGVII